MTPLNNENSSLFELRNFLEKYDSSNLTKTEKAVLNILIVNKTFLNTTNLFKLEKLWIMSH